MSFLELSENSKVHVQEIDSQHEKLTGLLNQLHDAMAQRQEKAALDLLVSELCEFTREHFAYEESLMSEYEYPDYPKHKEEHTKLLKHIVDLENQYRGGDLLLSFGIIIDLKGWAMIHIEKSDKTLGTFLNSKNVF
ncbi:MAG: hemerythrin [Gammaproteobacteria bacterium]|nr:MAG: hemerythrin [Gammaproteobacteria bacterium]